jgi:hypothetical protein
MNEPNEPVHSHRRKQPRPVHGPEPPKFWIPRLQEWLTLEQMAFRDILESEKEDETCKDC